MVSTFAETTGCGAAFETAIDDEGATDTTPALTTIAAATATIRLHGLFTVSPTLQRIGSRPAARHFGHHQAQSPRYSQAPLER